MPFFASMPMLIADIKMASPFFIDCHGRFETVFVGTHSAYVGSYSHNVGRYSPYVCCYSRMTTKCRIWSRVRKNFKNCLALLDKILQK